MACKRKTPAAFFLLFSAVLLFTARLTGCSSSNKVPVLEQEAIEELEPDKEPTLAELAAALEAYWKAADTADSPLFEAPAALPAGNRLARKRETALGDFLADAEKGFLEAHGITTDFAFINAELIRAGLPEGPVSKQDIERVLPFGQTICIVELTGAQLRDLVLAIGALPQGAGGFAQVSDGISYTLTFDETGFEPVISDVHVGGRIIFLGQTYRVALNDFVAAGGSGYDFFLRDDVVKVDTSIKLTDAIADYCSTNAESLYMKQGERITVIGGITE